MAELNTDVRFVRGVGEARAKSLAKLGITDLKSLISYFPRAYEDRRESRRIAELQVGERACVTAMVASEPKLSRIRKGLELVKLRVVDESAALELTYFNQSYLKNTFHVGESYTFYGTVEGTLLRRTMTNPAFEREGLHDVTGCIVPVYPLTAGVGQSLLHRAIRQGLDEGADRLPDLLPAELRRQHGLCDVRYAYENIHFPADDAALAERMGVKVRLTEGDVENIKLTTPEDMLLARQVILRREGQKEEKPMVRIGHGYDVHRLTEDRKLILCGVEIPYTLGLLGHSDADVALHALMDALLGAAALGDIGRHFPDTDPAYKGADSGKLLDHVVALLEKKGYAVGNVDVTIICQRPKLKDYIEQMRQNVARHLKVDADCVNIKATTTEKLGFEGEGLGISSHAVACIEKA